MKILRFPGYLLAIIRAFLIVTIMIILIAYYLVASSIFFKHTSESAFKLRLFFLKLAIPILGIKVDEIKGEPIKETALYVCNHRSFSDPVILCRFINAYVIAKAEVAGMPIIDRGARLTGVIYVKRDSTESRKSTREIMVDLLKQDLNIMVYPEGTTNNQIEVLEYKMGTFKECTENNFPIVPVILEYHSERDLWKNRGLFSQLMRQYSKWNTRVKIEIGKPLISDDFKEVHREAVDWSNATILRMHKGWGSHFDA